MPFPNAQPFPTIQIPVSLPQIAEGLRHLSPGDLETLELLVDEKAMCMIEESRLESERGNLREL